MHQPRRRARAPSSSTDNANNSDDPNAAIDALLQQPDPLDEAEQEAVVRGLRLQAERQRARGGAALACLGALVALFFTWLALEQALHPWQQRHTGELLIVLEDVFPPPGLVLAAQAGGLWASAAAAAAAAPRPGARRRCDHALLLLFLRLAAAAGASCGAAYWSLAMAAHARKYRELGVPWELSWVPLAPLLVVGASELALSAFEATAAEVAALARLRYAHKRV